jgi:hypothetical protein
MQEQLGTMYPHPEEGIHQWCEKQNIVEIGLWIMWGTTEMQTCVTPHLYLRNVAITGAVAPVDKWEKNNFMAANDKPPKNLIKNHSDYKCTNKIQTFVVCMSVHSYTIYNIVHFSAHFFSAINKVYIYFWKDVCVV